MTHPKMALAAVILLVACAGDDAGEWQGTVTDSAGVPIVMNTGAGIWSEGEGWTVEQELAIGAAEGDPGYQFGQIIGMDVDSGGRIYVLDQQAAEVRVFSPEGELVTRMGRQGSGPGELSPQAGDVMVVGDTVLVPDLGNQRIARFTTDGEEAGSAPLPMMGGIPTRWMKAHDRGVVQQSMVMAMPGQQGVEQRNVILRRDAHGEITDTIAVLPFGGTMDFSSGQPRMTLFAPEPMWAVGSDGRFVYGTNSEYRFRILSPEGDLSRVVEKTTVPRPLTESDQAAFRRLIRQAWQDAGMPPQAMDMMAQSLHFAESYPAYANLFGGPDGTIWVQSVQTPETVEAAGGTFDIQDIGGPTWDVFDSEGRHLGVVTMPDRFTPMRFQGDHIYGVLRDDLDVQYATRMKLNRGQASLGD